MTIGDQVVKMQLWDTSGQERFRSMTQAYYRGASGIMLVYDVTEENTLLTLPDWLGDIKNVSPICQVCVNKFTAPQICSNVRFYKSVHVLSVIRKKKNQKQNKTIILQLSNQQFYYTTIVLKCEIYVPVSLYAYSIIHLK